MLNDILKITLEYLNNHQKVDSTYLTKVIDIVITKDNLQSYVTIDLISTPCNFNNIAEYDFLTKTVCFNYLKINKHINNILKKYYFTDLEKEVLPFIVYLQTIFHELDHALRYKNIAINNQDEITSILLLSDSYNSYLLQNNGYQTEEYLENTYGSKFRRYLRYLNKNNNKYYEISPIENIAEVEAYIKIIYILNNLSFPLDNILNLVYYNLYYVLGNKYLKYNIPLEYYFKVMEYKESWLIKEGIEIANKYEKVQLYQKKFDLIHLLMLGFSVNNQEINSINYKLDSLERKLHQKC